MAVGVALAATVLASVVPAAAVAADRPQRVFERVTPGGKGGSPIVTGFRATPDGDAIAYDSYAVLTDQPNAVFASVYVARRSPAGWRTQSLTPRLAEPNPSLALSPGSAGISDDLGVAYFRVPAALDADDRNGVEDIAAVTAGSATSWITPATTLPDTSSAVSTYAGTSADGRYAFVRTTKPLLPGAPSTNEVYRRGPAGTELVTVLPNGLPSGGGQLGNGRAGNVGTVGDRNAISADGETVFFSTTTGVPQLYVRRAGVTKLVSADTNGAPGATAAIYWAAASDGSRVLFSSTSQLTTGAPVGGGLYAYDVASGQLQLVFGGGVSGVMRPTADGKRFYVVSTATLVPGQGTTGPKLYLVTEGGIRFVATLVAADATNWGKGEAAIPFAMTPDARRFVFTSRAKLSDTTISGARTLVYRFDADAPAGPGAITCLSCRPDGTPVNANATLTDGEFSASPGRSVTRGITDDGRLTVFEAAQDLLPEDTNGLTDVYGYDEHGLHLISTGAVGKAARVVSLGADGRDVFLRTNESLSADDTDGGYVDIYDARIGGGFPAAPAPPCSAVDCDRPDAPATAFAPVGLGSLGVLDASLPAESIVKPTGFTVAAISAANRSSWARSGRFGLKVTVDGAATVTATARTSGGKQAARSRQAAKAAGSVTLPLALTKASRAELRRTGRLKLTVSVAVSGAAKGVKATVALSARKTAAKAAKKAKKTKARASTKGTR